jgi:glycosyltransferase involved in cell wall biosynthesis
MRIKSFQIVLLLAGNAAYYMGGPALTMRMLLKAKEATAADSPRISAVFSDRIISSYHDFACLPSRDKVARNSVCLLVRLSAQTFGFLYHFLVAFRKLRRNRVVFHAQGVTPIYLCSLLFGRRYPLLLTFHGKGGHVREPLRQYPGLRFLEKFLRHVETRAVKQADVIIFTSEGARVLFESEYPELLKSKDIRIVHAGVDLSELDSVPMDNNFLHEFGVDPGAFVLLCVAKLIEDKGVDTLIEAIASLPTDIRSRLSCLIVGRGQLEEELQSLIVQRSLQERIKILGFLTRSQLLGLMVKTDLFILPSRVSVFDYVLLEAGAMKLPIITTAVGGNLEMFDKESAILVPPNDTQALAKAISEVIADADRKRRLAENAYQRIKSRFSLNNMLDSYISIYTEILERHK